jgi:hypothetical protein
VCKAENAQGPSCRRCKADLSLLFTLEEHRRRALQRACLYVAQGDGAAAEQQADQADQLRSDGQSRRLLALALLLQRDFAGAWECYLQARRADGAAAG